MFTSLFFFQKNYRLIAIHLSKNQACDTDANKKRIQTFKETWDSLYTYQNKLDKACFQLDMDYRDFKYLFRRTFSAKSLRDKTFNTSKNSKNDEYQR